MSAILCDCWDGRSFGPRPSEECPVRREMAMLRTPEGKAQLQAEYRAALRERANGKPTDDEIFRRLLSLEVPTASVNALRRATDTAAMRAAKAFCGPFARSPILTLMGPPGTGKTTAAAEVVREFAKSWDWNGQPSGETRRPCMFVEGRALTGLDQFDAEQKSWLETMRTARLLVLDDLGDEGTDTGRNALADIVLTRIDRNRRTVLTGNLKADALAKRYGAALFDRLRSVALMPNLWGEKSMRGRPS